MQRDRARSAALYTSLGLLLGTTALAAPALALAQEATATQRPGGPAAEAPPPEPAAAPPAPAVQSGVVRRIPVRGNERIEEAPVISSLPIQVGDVADPARIDLGLKTLFRTDLFSDVKIELQSDGVLVVTVN